MRTYLPFLLLLLFYLAFSCLGAINQAAPVNLPNTIPEMNTPGFWISRHPNPDSLIMNSQQIAAFNERANRQGTVTRIGQVDTRYSGSAVRKDIRELIRILATVAKYDSIGNRVTSEIIDSLRAKANVEEVPPSVKVRFGFPVTLARQRFAPSDINLNSDSLDVEFDQLQNSGYDIGTPTVFYQDSADGKWVFGACSTSMGWYRKSEICFIYHCDWLSYFQAEQRVVAIKAKADLWQNSSATRYLTYCRMGTSFPLVGEVGDYYQIQVPQSDGFGTAFIAKGDAHIGYLPYTARNIYQQAFRMLGVAYGWGDMRGDFDCSSLLKHLFSCFGIFLPRNGLQQAKAASLLYEFALRDSEAYRDSIIVNTAMPAATLLRLSGHIMLYLGSYQGKPFALHNIWGYRKPDETGKDQVFVINKTTISDLSLGANSKRGSLLQRVTMLSAIK